MLTFGSSLGKGARHMGQEEDVLLVDRIRSRHIVSMECPQGSVTGSSKTSKHTAHVRYSGTAITENITDCSCHDIQFASSKFYSFPTNFRQSRLSVPSVKRSTETPRPRAV
eukprot:9093659-Pyramimonas_sp.AAC.1